MQARSLKVSWVPMGHHDGADRLHTAVLIDPVTANDCRAGMSDRVDNKAQVSPSDALSPSTTP